MPIFTTDTLVARVRRRAQVGESAYTDQEILDVAMEQILTGPLSSLKAVRENYRLARTDIATVADQATYRIPERAQGGTLRTVSLVRGDTEAHLALLSLRDLEGDRSAAAWHGYVIEGELVTIIPTPTVSTDYVRLRYQLAFPKLVPVSEAPQITAIVDNGNGTWTFTASPNLPSAWVDTDEIDIIQGRSGFDTLETDVDVQGVESANEITVPTPSSEVQVGDYVALAGESPVITLPDILHPAVYGFTASRILFEAGEVRGGGIERGMAESDLKRAVASLSPRTDGRVRRIVNWNSPLRRGRRGR